MERPQSEPQLSSLPPTYRACLDIFDALTNHQNIMIVLRRQEPGLPEIIHIQYQTLIADDLSNLISATPENGPAPVWTISYGNLQADITFIEKYPSKYAQNIAETLRFMIDIQIKNYYEIQRLENFYHDLRNKLANLPFLAAYIKQAFPESALYKSLTASLQEVHETCAEFEKKKTIKPKPLYIELPYFPELSNAVLGIINADAAFTSCKSGEYKKIPYSDQISSQSLLDWMKFIEVIRDRVSQLKFEQNAAQERILALGRKIQSLIIIYQQILRNRNSILAEGGNIQPGTQECFAKIRRILVNVVDFFNASFLQKPEKKWHSLGEMLRSVSNIGSIDIAGEVEYIHIQCVDVELIRILENLIKNAFVHAGQKQIQINFHITVDFLEISVRSEGNELDPKDLPYLFQPGYRGKSARNKEGKGLGLAICKDICDKNNWQIKAENHFLGGVQFTIVIPSQEVDWK